MQRTWLAGVLVALLIVGPFVGTARGTERYVEDVGWGMAAVGISVFYCPAKVVYAGVGGIVGSMVYGVTAGRLDAAHRVWSASLGGTYVVTPAMVRGEEPILFVGETYRW